MSTSVASAIKFFPTAQNGFTTTTSGAVSSGATTVSLNSVAGYSNGDTAVFVIDPTDATKKQTFTGVVDTAGVQVTGVVWTAGTNVAHNSGATVVDYATATHISLITKGLLVAHNQDGTLKTNVALTTNNANLTTPVLTTPTIRNWDGWADANESWAYASATTMTVPTDGTTKYSVGDRIKLTQSATVKYFSVVGVTATVLTVTGGADYTLTNNAITANYYSKAASPLGFPTYFSYSPTYTGFSANPTANTYFRVTGRTVDLWHATNTLGTSNATSFLISLPVTAATVGTGQVWSVPVRAYNSGALAASGDYLFITSAGTTLTIAHGDSGSGWTASGTKGASFQVSYGI